MKLCSFSQEKQKRREKSEKIHKIWRDRNIFSFNYLVIALIFLRALWEMGKTVFQLSTGSCPLVLDKLPELSSKGSTLEHCERNRDCNTVWLNHFCCKSMNWNEGICFVYGVCCSFPVLGKPVTDMK